MDFFPHQFTGPVDIFDFGRMAYSVVYLPKALEANLPLNDHPRLRIIGEIDGRHFEGALQPTGEGWYILLSKKKLKMLGKARGDEVSVVFRIDDQDAVRLPDELTRALADMPDLREDWDALTPGKRRGLAHRVASAKMADTRQRRIDEIMAALADGEIDRLYKKS